MDFIEELYRHMLDVKLLAKLQMDVLFELFRDYVIIGGMPEVANTYIKTLLSRLN